MRGALALALAAALGLALADLVQWAVAHPLGRLIVASVIAALALALMGLLWYAGRTS